MKYDKTLIYDFFLCERHGSALQEGILCTIYGYGCRWRWLYQPLGGCVEAFRGVALRVRSSRFSTHLITSSICSPRHFTLWQYILLFIKPSPYLLGVLVACLSYTSLFRFKPTLHDASRAFDLADTNYALIYYAYGYCIPYGEDRLVYSLSKPIPPWNILRACHVSAMARNVV